MRTFTDKGCLALFSLFSGRFRKSLTIQAIIPGQTVRLAAQDQRADMEVKPKQDDTPVTGAPIRLQTAAFGQAVPEAGFSVGPGKVQSAGAPFVGKQTPDQANPRT